MNSEHEVVVMDWPEAYPASSGIKCIRCGKCRLGWFTDEKGIAPLSPGCTPKKPSAEESSCAS